MALNWRCYPKVWIDADTWTYRLQVKSLDTGTATNFLHSETAGVVATTELLLLKLGFDLVTGDTDDAQDIDDALFVDDIRPGPQVETVWGNWRDLAESIISGLAAGYSEEDFQAAWRTQDTNAVRTDARRALVTQRGWTVANVHQHEGDGTVTEE